MVENNKYKRWKAFFKDVPMEEWDFAVENLEWLVDWCLRAARRIEEDKKKPQEPPAAT